MINLSRSNDQHGSRVESKHKSTALARTTPKSKSRFAKQVSRYDELKAIITKYFEDRVKAGSALKEIRDDKLYKKEYKTFEEFCINHCGMSRAQAYRQMELPEMAESLKMSQIETNGMKESQARALSAAPEEDRVEVLETVASSGPVTAKRIDEEVTTRKGKSKPVVIDVTPEPEVQKRVHDCPTCRCATVKEKK